MDAETSESKSNQERTMDKTLDPHEIKFFQRNISNASAELDTCLLVISKRAISFECIKSTAGKIWCRVPQTRWVNNERRLRGRGKYTTIAAAHDSLVAGAQINTRPFFTARLICPRDFYGRLECFERAGVNAFLLRELFSFTFHCAQTPASIHRN